jgi:uncharacterized membrane protein
MDRYEALLVLHVVAVVIWLGAGFLLAFLIWDAERVGDKARHLGYHQDIARLSNRFFIPASLSVLVLGVLLVLDGPWDFGQLWIQIGIAGYLVSFLLGILYFKPTGERVAELIAEHGPDHPEIDRRVGSMGVVDRVQVLILFLVVADMILKPTGDDTGLLLGGTAILLVALALASLSIRRRAPATA